MGLTFNPTSLPGVFLVDSEVRRDERGSFERTYCDDEFRAHGLNTDWPQSNLSCNTLRGTLRGMHFQAAPHEEPKLVRCTRGRIFDVVVDLRAESATRLRWFGVELDATEHRSLYVPSGFAHGFQTLADNCEVAYKMGARYEAGAARGVRWNDPRLAINWPIASPILSLRDASYPDVT